MDTGAIDTSVVYDTRDNPLNPTRGAFISLNLSVAPKILGSDFDYVRQLLQVSFNVADRADDDLVAALLRRHHQHLRRRPAARHATSSGPAARSSVRGYATDSLGPQTAAGRGARRRGHARPQPGAALPAPHGARRAPSSTTPATCTSGCRTSTCKLQHSVGVGLRYAAGFGLVRLDLAFPLNRRPEDRSYQFWFGFGQVF